MIDGELRRGTANDRWLCVGVDISEEMVGLAYTYPCRKGTEYVQAAEVSTITESRSQRPARLVPTLMDRARWSVWLTRRVVSDHSRTGQTADFHPQLPKRPGRATSAVGNRRRSAERPKWAHSSRHGAALYARFRDHLIGRLAASAGRYRRFAPLQQYLGKLDRWAITPPPRQSAQPATPPSPPHPRAPSGTSGRNRS
jgi:hypothetical protein